MSRVHFLSLGCPKNRVDAERMLGIALDGGHELVDDPADADTIVVNTCAFIGDAKKESVEALLEMGELKSRAADAGEEKRLVATGCLAQRYVGDLSESLPEVDHFIGTSDYAQIGDVLAGAEPATSESNEDARNADGLIPLTSLKRNPARNLVTDDLVYLERAELPRVNSMPRHTAYLKVSEGCDNICAFCIIPTLRGKQRSRTVPDLVAEARALAENGVVELTLIAQDLTAFGHDLEKVDGKKPTLADLLAALEDVEGIRWVRCMYAYPRTLSGALMERLDEGKNTLPYLDISTQHGSDKVLKRMRRGRDQRRLKELLLSCQDAVRNLVLRSTVIVGFPGEDDADYEKLVDFVESVRFERLGVFKYSDEEGTAAFDLDEKLPYKVKRARFDKLMRRQRKIHRQHMKALVGQVHEAIVDGPSDEHEYLVVGRLWSQAPEVDGITYLSSERPLEAGQIVHVRVTESHDYDVVGEVLNEDDPAIATSFPFGARTTQAPASAVPVLRDRPAG